MPSAGVVTMSDPQGKGYDPVAKTGGIGFTTGAFARDINITGLPMLDITLSIDRPAANLAVTLYDVLPNGTWIEWDHGTRNLVHRESRESGSPVVPGVSFHTTVNLYPTQTRLEAGHKLGIALSPELPAWMEPQPVGAGATYTIALGEQGAVLHVLTLADGSAQALRAATTATMPSASSGVLGFI